MQHKEALYNVSDKAKGLALDDPLAWRGNVVKSINIDVRCDMCTQNIQGKFH